MVQYKWFFHLKYRIPKGGICDEKIAKLDTVVDGSALWPFPVYRCERLRISFDHPIRGERQFDSAGFGFPVERYFRDCVDSRHFLLAGAARKNCGRHGRCSVLHRLQRVFRGLAVLQELDGNTYMAGWTHHRAFRDYVPDHMERAQRLSKAETGAKAATSASGGGSLKQFAQILHRLVNIA